MVSVKKSYRINDLKYQNSPYFLSKVYAGNINSHVHDVVLMINKSRENKVRLI